MARITFTMFLWLITETLYSQEFEVQLAVQTGHFSQINVVKFSHDGKYIVTGANDRLLKLWDTRTRREIRTINVETPVFSADFSHDTRFVASVTSQKVLHVWESATGREILDKQDIQIAKFLNETNDFITLEKDIIRLWSVDSDEPIKEFSTTIEKTVNGQLQTRPDGPKWNAVDISYDDKYLITANKDREVLLWDIQTGQLLRKYKKHNTPSFESSEFYVDFSPIDHTFLVASEYQGILRYDADSNSDPETVMESDILNPRSGRRFVINGLSFDPTGTKVAALFLHAQQGDLGDRKNTKNFHLFDLNNKTRIISEDLGDLVLTNKNRTNIIGFNPNSNEIIIAEKNQARIFKIQATVEKTDVLGGYLSNQKEDIEYFITRIAKDHIISTNGQYIIKRVGKQVVAWDLKKGRVIREFGNHDDLVLSMSISDDGKFLATADDTIWIWDFETGELLAKSWALEKIYSMKFTGSGYNLIVSRLNQSVGSEVSLWDFNGTEIKFLKKLTNVPGSYAWLNTPLDVRLNSNGFYMSWSHKIFDANTGEEVKELKGHTATVRTMDFSPDGRSLATGDLEGKVFMWDLFSGMKMQQFSSEKSVYSIRFSPDGKLIAIGGADNNVKLWDISTGKLINTLEGHKSAVNAVSFTPDQKQIVSSSLDGTTKVWDLETGNLIYTHIVTGGKDWMAVVPSGQLYATDGAISFISFVKGMEIYHVDQFFEDFFIPGIVENQFADNGGIQRSIEVNLSQKLKDFPPPSIQIMSPKSGDFDSEKSDILVKINNTGGGLSVVKLMNNGKTVILDKEKLDLVKDGKSIIKSYPIQLVPGSNHIEVSAFSMGNIESGSAVVDIITPVTSPVVNCYVLAVGINEYRNASLNLNYAVADAKGFSNTIQEKGKGLYKNIEVHTIFNKDATKANILSKLEELTLKVQPEDVFYFYYAGHGSLVDDRFYFIPTDNVRLYEPEALEKNAIYAGEVQSILKDMPALKQVIVIDACHAGGSVEQLATRGGGEEKALAQLSRSAGVHVFASAGSEQYAGEFETLGHGIFTYVLLKGINGEADGAPLDGKVTIYELKSYLDDQVPVLSKELKGNSQYPNTFSRGHDFPIVIQQK